MNIRFSFLLAAAVACSGAFGAVWIHHPSTTSLPNGSYVLKISDETRGLALLSGEAIPTGKLVVADGQKFVLETTIGQRLIHREGRIDLDGEDLTLSFGSDLHLKGKSHDPGVVEIAGLRFVRQESGSVTGLWRVRNVDARLEFLPDGTFKFVCTGAKSAGKYKCDGGNLVLTWTSVDGEAVEPDTMHKTLLLDDQGTFWIDNYHYQRS